GRLRASADASADQYVHRLSGQKACQCSMAHTIGSDHFAGYYPVVFHLIYFEKFCFSEMLKNISIVISYCYLHISILFFLVGSVKYYLFFLYLNPLKTLILREICNKKSIDLPFRV